MVAAFETIDLPLTQGAQPLGGQEFYGIRRAFSKQYGVSQMIDGEWITVAMVGPVPVP